MTIKLTQILLLFAMAFNIAHASIIATEEHCVHESTCHTLVKQDFDVESGDLCDFHHLFHFTAIIETTIFQFDAEVKNRQPAAEPFNYYPPLKEAAHKPPIA